MMMMMMMMMMTMIRAIIITVTFVYLTLMLIIQFRSSLFQEKIRRSLINIQSQYAFWGSGKQLLKY
jgi:hypothetical protein